jgi:AcrR family transcriptional regulator
MVAPGNELFAACPHPANPVVAAGPRSPRQTGHRCCNTELHVPYSSAMATRAPQVDGRRKAAAARRRARKAQIIAATREIFDSKGVRDVQIEEIAGAVGINRAIVYRHFTGKEELFALTLVGYLDELHDLMREAADTDAEPRSKLAAVVGAFVDYGIAHPAFVDCAQALMIRPGDELLDEISEGALFRLGRGITSCLTILSDLLADGVDQGAFEVSEDPVLLANMLYASGLGALQLARLGILVSESAPGIPTVGQISHEQVRNYLVTSALALVTGQTAHA